MGSSTGCRGRRVPSAPPPTPQGQTSVTLRSQVQSEAAADAAAEPAVDEAAVDEPEPPQAARPRAAAETPAAFRKLRRVIIFFIMFSSLSFGQHFQDLQGVFPFRPCCC